MGGVVAEAGVNPAMKQQGLQPGEWLHCQTADLEQQGDG